MRVSRSIGTGLFLGLVMCVALATSAGAKEAPTVSVGSWSYDAATHDIRASGVDWTGVRADSACIVVAQPGASLASGFLCTNPRPRDNKSPQNWTIDSTAYSPWPGTTYDLSVVVYKGTTPVATSATVQIVGGTNYP